MRETIDINESKPSARSVPMTSSLPASLSMPSSTIELRKPETPSYNETANATTSRVNTYDWKLEKPLPRFPSEFCLQRHTTFVANASPDTILQRLGRRLRHASCDCHWNGEGQLEIINKNCKFSIFLWRSDDDDDNSTLVELQRLQGCSVATQWCRRRLFRAVVEPSEPSSACDLLELPAFPCVPESCKTHAVLTQGNVYPQQTSGFEQVEGLLQSSCRRQNQLGLEQMLYLLRKEPLETTKRVFQEHALMKYLQKYIYQDESCIMDGREETILAWQFLAQAFSAVAQYEEEERVVIDRAMLQECHFEKAIQQSLKRVQDRPQEATFAIQCWYWIDHFVPLSLLDEEEALMYLKEAHAYGEKHNHCLEQESFKMIQIFTLASCGSKQPL